MKYLWIIIAVIIFVLMTVVGYYADKTDFGKNKLEKKPKPVKEKKEKHLKKEITVQEELEDNIPTTIPETNEEFFQIEPKQRNYMELLPEENMTEEVKVPEKKAKKKWKFGKKQKPIEELEKETIPFQQDITIDPLMEMPTLSNDFEESDDDDLLQTIDLHEKLPDLDSIADNNNDDLWNF